MVPVSTLLALLLWSDVGLLPFGPGCGGLFLLLSMLGRRAVRKGDAF